MTVLRAIQSAGDFTYFANRKKIKLIRENSQKFEINRYKAIEDPTQYDLPVYPNDQIIVHKRYGLWW
jgi:protein involved in polysaccharide export with SLBB domain